MQSNEQHTGREGEGEKKERKKPALLAQGDKQHREEREERTEEEESKEGQCLDIKSEIGSKSEIAWVVQALTSLWLKTHLATSRDCLQKLICITNNDIAQRSALAWTLAEAGRYVPREGVINVWTKKRL